MLKEPTKRLRPKKGLCAALGCQNKTSGKTFCSTHRSTLSRLSNPYAYAYSNLKHSATRRGIPFDLSLEEFTAWAQAKGYLAKKGLRSDGYTVGRLNEFSALGYHGYRLDNIEIQTMPENVRHYHDQRRKFAGEWTASADEQQNHDDDLPF